MAEIGTALRELLHQRVNSRGVVGLAIAIGPGAEPEAIWMPGSLDEEPAFLAYSIAKTFTAALMLLLQEDGRLDLDDTLVRWFPGVPSSDRISIRQLLNHTGGVPDYGSLRSYHESVRRSPGRPWSFDRFAAETFEKGLAFQPGMGWAYSNPGYMLLKRIAEELTGQTYATLISRRIADPLGLRRTFVAQSISDLSSLAPAPSAVLSLDGRCKDSRLVYHPGWVSPGVLASTPSEITRFFGAVLGADFLSKRSLQEMTEVVCVPNAPPRWRKPSYGLGLMGDPQSPWGALWGHSGAGPGYNTSAFHAADLRGHPVTVCAMCAIEEDSIAEQLALAAIDLAHECLGGDR